MANAKRNLDAYARFGVTVRPDVLPDDPGPLAAPATGFAHCRASHTASARCDCPHVPSDLR